MKKIIFLGLMLLNIEFTVNAQVQLTVSNPSPICTGGAAILTAGGASTYSWTPSTGLSATTGATVKAKPSATTVYSVTGTTGSSSETKQVTVVVDSTCNAKCLSSAGEGSFNWVGCDHYYTCDNNTNDIIGGPSGNMQNTGSSPYVAGVINNGLSFNGTNQFCLCPANSFNPTGDFTISLWFKVNNLNTASTLFSNGSSSSNGISVSINSSNRMSIIIMGGGGVIISKTGTINLSASTWYHLLVVRELSSGRCSVYLNNVLDFTTVGNGAPTWNYGGTQGVALGANIQTYSTGSYSSYFNGVIDEFALFKRAISDNERIQLYNGGVGRQAPY